MNRVQQQHGQDYSSRMSKRQKIRMYRGVIVTVAVLAACLIADMAWSSAKAASYGTGEDESGHIIIYQVYGRGDNTDAAISHSFIELYNPTESDVPLDEWSLQYTAEGGKWKILPLKGVIPSRSSFLVRCFTVDGIASRYTVSKYDMDWGFRKISNNGYKVALVGPGGELAEADPSQGDDIVDFVGVGDTDFGDGPTVGGISKQKAVRRVSVKDTNDNAADFEVIDYRDRRLSDDILDLVRPRTAAEGAWDPAVSKLEGTLLFSAPAGLYSAPFSLSLSTTFADGVIRYTTDGTAPTARSPVFSGGIAIDDRTGEPERLANISNITKRGADPPTEKVFKGACVKARVYTKAGEPLSPVITQSYFVNPEIFSKYNGLPIISMVTDPANLFDKKTGIYTYDNFKYHGAEWERPVHVELFEGDGRLAFSQDMGMRVHGLSGREYAQKSFRLYPRGSLGTDEPILGYDLFEGLALDVDGAPITAFHNFILRNCGDGWNKASIRDTLIQRVCGQA
ncbi:MAG: chitobiase/beta-hexosaminidase C-terminal domain-containing protein, partial [Clostridiales bacterium]|nr:chitobiase/beta-hexosaminidase C-terminal domain-containing protein [Clostridiales bacterium]